MNQKIISIVLLMAAALIYFACGNQGNTDTNENANRLYKDTMYVEAGGGLRMRSAPNTSAAKVVTIPDGAQVTVLEESGEEIQLAGKSGKWVKVKYEGQEGWVFGGLLNDKNSTSESTNPESESVSVCQKNFSKLIDEWPKAANGNLIYSTVHSQIRDAVSRMHNWKCRQEFDPDKTWNHDADTYCGKNNLNMKGKYDKDCMVLMQTLWNTNIDPFKKK